MKWIKAPFAEVFLISIYISWFLCQVLLSSTRYQKTPTGCYCVSYSAVAATTSGLGIAVQIIRLLLLPKPNIWIPQFENLLSATLVAVRKKESAASHFGCRTTQGSILWAPQEGLCPSHTIACGNVSGFSQHFPCNSIFTITTQFKVKILKVFLRIIPFQRYKSPLSWEWTVFSQLKHGEKLIIQLLLFS